VAQFLGVEQAQCVKTLIIKTALIFSCLEKATFSILAA
jgi:hypothetical protein